MMEIARLIFSRSSDDADAEQTCSVQLSDDHIKTILKVFGARRRGPSKRFLREGILKHLRTLGAARMGRIARDMGVRSNRLGWPLNELCREGKIVRVRRGVYNLASTDADEDEFEGGEVNAPATPEGAETRREILALLEPGRDSDLSRRDGAEATLPDLMEWTGRSDRWLRTVMAALTHDGHTVQTGPDAWRLR